MATTKLGEQLVQTSGALPSIGAPAPEFTLVDTNLREISLREFAGRSVVLNIFPSIETRVCATSARQFNKYASSLPDTVVCCVSKDLPFAFTRFCEAEGIRNVVALSGFRSSAFGRNYGIELVDGAFAGLYARAVILIDRSGKIVYTELVPSIDLEPDYDKCLAAIDKS